ncbi:helix-turn-helix domain-containing protein [Flavobacterium sp. MC2016-06]|jgi:AraC family transcriptional activator of pobA|uniref:helix-turn-helix domain-containing protein n=1 Tax=Flavobacterium sp. MC2016-06 TaxID=2676308 RepID=UPI0012BB069F|nr:helix-turn-helix domain-containing protein [Flavobacterium sp. MC2016-06]MBU3862295.1 helix-turn-helix domain-containing protein [Flavobacterium sp. MC2016-06]
MKPELSPLKKFKEILAFMNLPVFTYIDSDDFAIIRLQDLGLEMPYLTPTFRPDYYTFTTVRQGIANFVIGDEVFKLQPNNIHVTKPDIYFSSGWIESPVGYHICFNRNFFAKYLSAALDDFPITEDRNGLLYCFNQTDLNRYEEICESIYNEAVSNSKYKYEMISNLITNLLLLLQEDRSKVVMENQDEKHTFIIKTFHRNIDENFNLLLTGETSSVFRTKEHAEMLNLNETYLSKLISKTTGKTINQWINTKLIEEITYLLKNTDKPMSEIALMLGFNDMKYFYSFFKRHAKNSAASVRNNFNESDSDRTHVYRGDVVNIRPTW